MATSKTAVNGDKAARPRIVSKDEWLAERRALLAAEKEFTRMREALTAKRQAMPWVKLEKQYSFETPAGKKTLAELFGGKSQLLVYHFMLGPEWKEGCPSCSMAADSFNGIAVHTEQRDVTFTAVSRAPLAHIEAFKKRMGWRFKWASSFGSDFNPDFAVSFTKDDIERGKNYNFGTTSFPVDEAPGLSAFSKIGNDVYHTYSTYGRGLEDLLGAYVLLDRVAKGRDEEGLEWPMAWVRHHDKYSDGKLVELK
jgi:predicted dithiol-disulfide oxidoreductase (DUF899 family)